MVSGNGLKELLAASPAIGGKKSDVAYAIIKRAIILRNFGPGMLLREQELAREFQCSQGTVREALMRLDEDGLVERSGYRGTQITDISHAEAAEMVRVRLSIEQAVARAIARDGLADHDREGIEQIIAAMDQTQDREDHLQASELDRAFHARLARASGMSLLSPILERCSLHIHRFTLGGLEVPREFFRESGVAEEHRLLLDAVSSGDEARATTAIADHLRNVLERWAPSLLDAVGPEAFTPQAIVPRPST